MIIHSSAILMIHLQIRQYIYIVHTLALVEECINKHTALTCEYRRMVSNDNIICVHDSEKEIKKQKNALYYFPSSQHTITLCRLFDSIYLCYDKINP
jgi:hypothetical protein